jgi:hypothetical protein
MSHIFKLFNYFADILCRHYETVCQAFQYVLLERQGDSLFRWENTYWPELFFAPMCCDINQVVAAPGQSKNFLWGVDTFIYPW